MAILENAIANISRAEEVSKTQRPPGGVLKALRRVAILGAGTMGSRIAGGETDRTVHRDY